MGVQSVFASLRLDILWVAAGARMSSELMSAGPGSCRNVVCTDGVCVHARPAAWLRACHRSSALKWRLRMRCQLRAQVVASAAACLRPDGRLVAFSPCIEQTQRTAAALRAARFTDVRCLECLLRFHDVRTEAYFVPSAPPPDGDNGGAAAAPDRRVELEPAAAPPSAREGDAAAYHGEASANSGKAAADHGILGATGAEDPCSEPTARGDASCATPACEVGAGAETLGVGRGDADNNADGLAEHRRKRNRVVAMVDSAATKTRVATAPRMNARGHTGYLLFARKRVLPRNAAGHPAAQPL